jgi:DNA-binding NarL/FixJ family response regulator
MALKATNELDSVPAVPGRKYGVFVVDDHSMIRQGVARTVEADPDLALCGEAASVKEALAFLERTPADVVLLDLSLQSSDGVSFIKQLRARWPELPILVYSMHNEETYAERVLKAGASGYLMKDTPPQQLVAALKDVLQGEIALSKRMFTRLCRSVVTAGEVAAGDAIAAKLSDRELHVFQLIGTGLKTKAIAERLGVSTKTVEAHREQIKDKLSIEDAATLARRAAEWVNGALNGG